MQIKKKLNKLKELYIIFFSMVLFINIIFSTPLNANSFKITNLEISEPFELNFDKEKVIDKGFESAFYELVSMITTAADRPKIKNISLTLIKGLIDTFTMSEEKFINSEYHVKFDVYFNKKKTLNFFENKNIFPSIPRRKNVLLIPILVDIQNDKVSLFTNNVFYKKWNVINERFFLLNYLLPSEDIEDVNFLSQNSESVEDYDFKETIEKYDLKEYIITIIYKNNKKFRVLSKIKINESLKINNQKFENIDLLKEEDYYFLINYLKNIYEDNWKDINRINRSIKLPLTIYLKAKDYKKTELFEKALDELDLVFSKEISNFNSKNIFYKIIYNGPPNKFIDNMKDKNVLIIAKNQIWKVQ